MEGGGTCMEAGPLPTSMEVDGSFHGSSFTSVEVGGIYFHGSWWKLRSKLIYFHGNSHLLHHEVGVSMEVDGNVDRSRLKNENSVQVCPCPLKPFPFDFERGMYSTTCPEDAY